MEKLRNMEEKLPLLPLRGLAAFPNTSLYIDVGRDRSLAALEHAMEGDRRLLVVAQRKIDCEVPEMSDLYGVGTVVRVRHVMPVSEETVRLMCEGERRALLIAALIFYHGTARRATIKRLTKIAHLPLPYENKPRARRGLSINRAYLANRLSSAFRI